MANIHAPIMTDYNGHFGNGSNPLGETRANGTRLEAVVALSLRKSFIMIDQTEDNSSVNVTESMWYWYSDKSILIDDGSDRGITMIVSRHTQVLGTCKVLICVTGTDIVRRIS